MPITLINNTNSPLQQTNTLSNNSHKQALDGDVVGFRNRIANKDIRWLLWRKEN